MYGHHHTNQIGFHLVSVERLSMEQNVIKKSKRLSPFDNLYGFPYILQINSSVLGPLQVFSVDSFQNSALSIDYFVHIKGDDHQNENN